MTKRMLIDASHAEETRVVVLDGNQLEEFDLEVASRKPLKGNIYLAKVVRVEPSLQAAFVEYGGNRHGFLAFSEIHPDYYQIPVADRQRLLEMQAAEAEEDEEEPEQEEVPVPRPEAPEAPPAAPAAGAVAEEAPVAEAPAEQPGEVLATEALPDEAAAPDDRPAPGDAAEAGDAAPEEARAEAAALPNGHDEGGFEAVSANGEAANGEAEAREDLPPPETLGGEGAEEVARERRIPPKFLRHYKIQEVIKRRQIMLVQVVKEERGTKGAALTTYISLAGRFSVLMPNSPRAGGISRKITSAADRKRLREIVDELGLPEGMSLIIRTAGAQRPKAEIKRDCEYLLRLWDSIRERTLQSTAPALIYEEADLIKRAIRDVFSRDVEEILVEGEEAYQQAREFMRMLMPQHVKKIQLAREGGLFARHQVEAHLDAMHSPTVPLKSGGYIVINQTEALVAIDVNSGRATRDRHIEDTALRTNLEAADEIARQLRLRDLAGLIVIDFIDMESAKHDAMVERRLKEALKQDRARIQVGRISHFGLLEMSRQRLRPSLAETTFVTCPHCQGRGQVRSVESSALQVLRAIEDEGAKRRAAEITVHVAAPVALYLLNRKRDRLAQIEARYRMSVLFEPDESLVGATLRIERTRAAEPGRPAPEAPAALRMDYAPEPEPAPEEEEAAPAAEEGEEEEEAAARGETEEARAGEAGGKRRRRRRRRRGGRGEEAAAGAEAKPEEGEAEGEEAGSEEAPAAGEAPGTEPAPAAAEAEGGPRRRRRRRRGPRPEGAPEEAATLPPRYSGPTPADPFAGHVDDIFAAMEAAEAALEAAARPMAGGAAPAGEEAPGAAWEAGAMAEPAPFQAEAPPLPEEAPAAEAAFVPPPEPASPPAAIPAAQAAPEPPAEAPEPAPARAAPAQAEEGEADGAAVQPAAPVQGPLVMPKVIGQVPIEAPRRTGWWRR